jgi:hypothetical protein
MCICTLLTCAVELAALANNKTSPNVVKKIFRLISVLLIWLQSRNRMGADSGTMQAHTNSDVPLRADTLRPCVLDQEREMLNIFGTGILWERRACVSARHRYGVVRRNARHHH